MKLINHNLQPVDFQNPTAAPARADSAFLRRSSFAQRAVLSAVACAAAALAVPAWSQVDPNQMVDALETAGGKHLGYRRSGAKGLCAVAEFVGNAEGRALSVSSAFSGKPVPVVARFSMGVGNPKAPRYCPSARSRCRAGRIAAPCCAGFWRYPVPWGCRHPSKSGPPPAPVCR